VTPTAAATPASLQAAFLTLAHDMADAAGKAILPHFRRAIAVENKASGRDFDPVTAADKAAERAISKRLAAAYPDHGLTGEEYGTRNPTARYRWVVDPIDGTRAFMTGALHWGTLIGLIDNGVPSLGLMDQPYVGERFWSDGKATYARGPNGRARKLRTRDCPKLADAIVGSTHPDLFLDREAIAFNRVKAQARMTRYGGDCYGYALVACGLVDVVIETGLKPFDIVALIPIIENAGGRVTTWDGRAADNGGRVVASGDPKLHETVLKLLNK
jgi:histidinol phosphatase-like enzyme (inositol monophosphatase family)